MDNDNNFSNYNNSIGLYTPPYGTQVERQMPLYLPQQPLIYHPESMIDLQVAGASASAYNQQKGHFASEPTLFKPVMYSGELGLSEQGVRGEPTMTRNTRSYNSSKKKKSVEPVNMKPHNVKKMRSMRSQTYLSSQNRMMDFNQDWPVMNYGQQAHTQLQLPFNQLPSTQFTSMSPPMAHSNSMPQLASMPQVPQVPQVQHVQQVQQVPQVSQMGQIGQMRPGLQFANSQFQGFGASMGMSQPYGSPDQQMRLPNEHFHDRSASLAGMGNLNSEGVVLGSQLPRMHSPNQLAANAPSQGLDGMHIKLPALQTPRMENEKTPMQDSKFSKHVLMTPNSIVGDEDDKTPNSSDCESSKSVKSDSEAKRMNPELGTHSKMPVIERFDEEKLQSFMNVYARQLENFLRGVADEYNMSEAIHRSQDKIGHDTVLLYLFRLRPEEIRVAAGVAA